MIAGVIARARSLWRGLRRRSAVEAEMSDEFRLHQELRAEDLVRGGLSPEAARRQARLEFGSAERYKDEARQSRGLRPFDDLRMSALDLRLGARMLVKYPGLTLVGGAAIAFAVATGATTFELVSQLVSPKLPFVDGDRIVGIQLWNASANRAEPRMLHDFATWRSELRTVTDVGAYRTYERNLVVEGGPGEPLEVAEISASAFRITHVAPLVGRALVPADEQPGAPPVVVVGHDVWRTRFASDPRVVGRTVRLGDVPYTLVGVMPAGYAFPVYHAAWVPMRLDPLAHAPRHGPALERVFGRLAPGVSVETAQRELDAVTARHARDGAATRTPLRALLRPWAQSVFNVSGLELLGLMSSNVFLLMLLVLVCGNVAMLMFARAATREGEIVVRNALGASRGRIVTQLFAEALVLAGLASVVGLAVAGLGLQLALGVARLGGPLPFWLRDRLSPTTLLYAALLALLVAVITGVVPALKITRGLAARLRGAAAGGGGPRFGGVWTAVIVCQVAVTVVFPVTAFYTRRDAVQLLALDVGFPAREFLSLRVEMDRGDTSSAAYEARFASTARELARRLEAEPRVEGVAFASLLPSTDHPQRRIEVGDVAASRADSAYPLRVSSVSIDSRYFDVLGAPVLAGRGFDSGDLGPERRVVVVNRAFVRGVLHGRNPLGARVRYVESEDPDADPSVPTPPSPWYEIVGVVPDLGMTDGSDPTESGAGIYHPVAPGPAAAHLAVHVRGDPAAFTTRLRAVAAEVDPALRLYDVMPLARLRDVALREIAFWFRLLVTVSAIALLLSLAGIYAVVAFAVSRRTREIGIRVALGSDRKRVVSSILARPLAQVGGGVAAGGVLAFALAAGIASGHPSLAQGALVVGYAVLMLGVCMLACLVPARRALRVQPTEALRSDG